MKKSLWIAGIVAAGVAALMALIGADLGANGRPSDIQPMTPVALALVSLALLKASELAPLDRP
ncbi:MAG: hypothetical protein AB1Z98_16585 [Nannocystaceae bacterium]